MVVRPISRRDDGKQKGKKGGEGAFAGLAGCVAVQGTYTLASSSKGSVETSGLRRCETRRSKPADAAGRHEQCGRMDNCRRGFNEFSMLPGIAMRDLER
ncbi:hypothetical protein [Paenibacillus solanacearum]|uniref:hypothetical protein n=1 Tax=Paenibacillus solanacearum TaxID=2048548 RepID=UPI001C406D7F|nr:hypothetical protein [Paenibacillus solanacearum]